MYLPGCVILGSLVRTQELVAALDGRLRDHHRFLIGQHLKTIEQIEATIAEFDARLEAALAPFRDAIERLKGIPGVSDNVAQTLIAEIGADMSAFPTADHLVSWAGMCPRLDESAGRKRSKRLRKGAPWLKPVLGAGGTVGDKSEELQHASPISQS